MGKNSPEKIVPRPLPTIEELGRRAIEASEASRQAESASRLAMTTYALSLQRRVGERFSFSAQPSSYVFDAAKAYAKEDQTEAAPAVKPGRSFLRRKERAAGEPSTPGTDGPRMVGVSVYSMLDEVREPIVFTDIALRGVYEEGENSGRWMLQVGGTNEPHGSYYVVPLNTVRDLQQAAAETVDS